MRTLTAIACLLLLFNGIGALYGGWSLINDPSGKDLQLPLTYLQASSFQDYFIPGLILFIVNGMFSMTTLIAVMMRFWFAPSLLLFQGFLLGGWIVIQIILLQMTYWLHWLMLSVALAMLVIGWLLKRTQPISHA